DQLHAAADTVRRALPPRDRMLCVGAQPPGQVSVHDRAALRAVRHGRVGSSVVHVLTDGGGAAERGHSGAPVTGRLPRRHGRCLANTTSIITVQARYRARGDGASGEMKGTVSAVEGRTQRESKTARTSLAQRARNRSG